MNDSTKSTDSTTTETATGYSTETKPEETKPAEETTKENEVDDYGYSEPVEEKPEETKPAEEQTEEEKSAEELKKEIESTLGDLPEFDRNRLTEFAVKNKMTKEQAEAYAEIVRSDIKETENNVKNQRSEWKKELVDDPTFGGDNFDQNIHRVEKLLENHLPNTKKVLTDRGSMMPPYIMKDLLGIAKALNPTTELVSGDPSVVEKKESGNFLEDMYK